jgi:hypothetical protein
MYNGDDVVDEFSMGSFSKVATLNDNCFTSMSLKHPLHEFECDTTQPVFVSNGKDLEISRHRKFQNPLESSTLEVDTRTDVGDNVEVWVSLSEEVDLMLEVVGLFSCGDSSVDDSLFCDGFVIGVTMSMFSDERFDVVSSLTSIHPDVFDTSIVRVRTERLLSDAKRFLRFGTSNESFIIHCSCSPGGFYFQGILRTYMIIYEEVVVNLRLSRAA